MSAGPIRILFVCQGNLCRSPAAEGIFRQLLAETGLAAHFEVASTGVGSWHVGDPPDERMCATARAHGVDLSRQRARKLSPLDLFRHDLVLAMDRAILEQVRASMRGGPASVQLFRDFDPAADEPDVPDPFYGPDAGFDAVFAIIDRTCRALLEQLRREHAL